MLNRFGIHVGNTLRNIPKKVKQYRTRRRDRGVANPRPEHDYKTHLWRKFRFRDSWDKKKDAKARRHGNNGQQANPNQHHIAPDLPHEKVLGQQPGLSGAQVSIQHPYVQTQKGPTAKPEPTSEEAPPIKFGTKSMTGGSLLEHDSSFRDSTYYSEVSSSVTTLPQTCTAPYPGHPCHNYSEMSRPSLAPSYTLAIANQDVLRGVGSQDTFPPQQQISQLHNRFPLSPAVREEQPHLVAPPGLTKPFEPGSNAGHSRDSNTEPIPRTMYSPPEPHRHVKRTTPVSHSPLADVLETDEPSTTVTSGPPRPEQNLDILLTADPELIMPESNHGTTIPTKAQDPCQHQHQNHNHASPPDMPPEIQAAQRKLQDRDPNGTKRTRWSTHYETTILPTLDSKLRSVSGFLSISPQFLWDDTYDFIVDITTETPVSDEVQGSIRSALSEKLPKDLYDVTGLEFWDDGDGLEYTCQSYSGGQVVVDNTISQSVPGPSGGDEGDGYGGDGSHGHGEGINTLTRNDPGLDEQKYGNPFPHYQPLCGDSVGPKTGPDTTGTLGPNIWIGGKSYWLINFHIFDGIVLPGGRHIKDWDKDTPPEGLELVQPSKWDLRNYLDLQREQEERESGRDTNSTGAPGQPQRIREATLTAVPQLCRCRSYSTRSGTASLGNLTYFSGQMYKSTRPSTSIHRHILSLSLLNPEESPLPTPEEPPHVIIDWALILASPEAEYCTNRVRFAPCGREFHCASEPFPGVVEVPPPSSTATVAEVKKALFPARTVFSTGRTSGTRWGVIGPAPANVRPHHPSAPWTREWQIQPLGQPDKEWQYRGLGVQGDSGAAVVDFETNELMGMVWGMDRRDGDGQKGGKTDSTEDKIDKTVTETEAAQRKKRPRRWREVYFTAIQDLFDDIEQKTKQPRPRLGVRQLSRGRVTRDKTMNSRRTDSGDTDGDNACGDGIMEDVVAGSSGVGGERQVGKAAEGESGGVVGSGGENKRREGNEQEGKKETIIAGSSGSGSKTLIIPKNPLPSTPSPPPTTRISILPLAHVENGRVLGDISRRPTSSPTSSPLSPSRRQSLTCGIQAQPVTIGAS